MLFAGILSTSFLQFFVFNPIFSFLVHYSLILKIASTSLKFSFNFQCHQMIKIVTKNCTQHLHIYSLNSSDKNFPFFEYLFSYCINSFSVYIFRAISCFLTYHPFTEDFLLLLFSLLHHNLLILLQSIPIFVKLFHFF